MRCGWDCPRRCADTTLLVAISPVSNRLRGLLTLLGWGLASAVFALDYEVVDVYPHDQQGFTQGLLYHSGYVYESTGLKGHSSLRQVNLKTGEVLQKLNLSRDYFAEGIAVVGDRILQLTWRSQVGFVYSVDDFKPLSTFRYDTEGWGLTYDGQRLIMTDGSANLYFLDPETFEKLATVAVSDAGRPVGKLNELEYIDGLIYANIFQTNRIAIIDPASGRVIDSLDLGVLVEAEIALTKSAGVLNGIAYDAQNNTMLVTGKNWRRLYAISLTP